MESETCKLTEGRRPNANIILLISNNKPRKNVNNNFPLYERMKFSGGIILSYKRMLKPLAQCAKEKNSKVYGRASKPMRKNPGRSELKACRAGVSEFFSILWRCSSRVSQETEWHACLRW